MFSTVFLSLRNNVVWHRWRAPGAAPVEDPCGMAGGTLPQFAGPGEAKYYPNAVAKQGDLGSKVRAKNPLLSIMINRRFPSSHTTKTIFFFTHFLVPFFVFTHFLFHGLLQVLKKGPTTASWNAGQVVEVVWGIRYNHGGVSCTEERRKPYQFLWLRYFPGNSFC